MALTVVPYNRQRAIDYAHQWAFSRNASYYNFDSDGGDCTNFVSQCVYAGSKVMNYTKDVGWYYISATNRAAAWTSVPHFYNFMTRNQQAGPFARAVDISELMIGDVIQLRREGDRFHHTLLIVQIVGQPAASSIQIATHTLDSDYRFLDTYTYQDIRYLHFDGVRNYL